MRRLRLNRYQLVVVLLLAATVVDAVVTSRGWHNSDFVNFAAGGRTMLSTHCAHTFHDPFIQAAPLELLAATVLHRIAGWSHASLAIATELTLAVALIAMTRSLIGRRVLPLAFVIVFALLLGVVPDAYATGHFAEPVAGLLWLLAARDARAGRVGRAGLLVGASAGFELWGILGVTVLALAPSLRQAARGAALAVGTLVLMLAPFMLAGDFHMFDFHWEVAGGLMHHIVGVGYPFGWPLRLLQGGTTVGLAVGLARLIRKSPAAIFVVPAATTAVRLLLDPLGMFYYWDPVTELALLGAATAFAQREALHAWAHARAAVATA